MRLALYVLYICTYVTIHLKNILDMVCSHEPIGA